MVSHSVIEVLEECERLVRLASVVNRVDVLYSVRELTKCKDELKEAYTDERYSEEESSRLKRKCEDSAINLESKLLGIYVDLDKRYEQRKYIHKVYNKVKEDIAVNLRCGDEEKFRELLLIYNRIKQYYREAQHILLIVSEEGLSEIEQIESCFR